MALEKFNYPDGTTSVAGITAISNNLVINGGKAYITSAEGSNFFIFDDSVSNGVSEMYAEEPQSTDKQYGFMVRYVDEDNNWLVTVADGRSGRCRLIKKENGQNTTVEEVYKDSAHETNANKLRVEVTDDSITLILNETWIATTYDEFLAGQGKSGFKMDDPSIAVNWVSYQNEEPASLVQSGKALSAQKLGQIVPMHSAMVTAGVSAEYWPYVVRGDTIPNWPSNKYPLIMYSSPDHAEVGQNVGVYVRVYNAELGLETETAAWEEWQDVSNRPEFDHISRKTNPIFTESAAPSETPSVISSNGTVYLLTHNILNAGSSGPVNQGTSLAKGVNGIDFETVASPLLSYDRSLEQGDMHTGYASVIENPIPSQPYAFLVNTTHGGGGLVRGPSQGIWGTNDIEDPESYKLITTFDRIFDTAITRGFTPDGWSVKWVHMLRSISTLKKDGSYYRLVLDLRKDVEEGGNNKPLLPVEVLIDENFNVVSTPNMFIDLGGPGEIDEAEITHYNEVEYKGTIYGFYRARAMDNSSSIAMLNVSQIDFDWNIIAPFSSKTELLKANSNDNSEINSTTSPTANADGLMEFPLDSSGVDNVIEMGSYTLSDFDVLELKVRRQAQTGVHAIYGEIGFFDNVATPAESFRFVWPNNNNALRFNVLVDGVNEDFGESRKIIGNYDVYSNNELAEHYNSRVWYGIRVIPALRKVQLLGGASVIGEYYVKDVDLTQPLTLAMKFSTPSGENTSMEIEEITVNTYSNEARGASTPTVNAGVNDAGLVGDTVQLNGTASDYDTLEWACTSGQTPIFSDTTILNPTVTFDEAGVHNLRLTATNAQGSTSDDVEFVITEEVDSTPPQITFVGGGTITLTVGDSYTPQVTAIDANDGTLTPTITNNVDTEAAGTYTVIATATDAAGNTGSASQTVIVEVAPVNQAPTANAGPDQSVAAATQFTLDGTGSQDPDGTIVEWQWTQTAGDTVTLDLSEPSSPSAVSPSKTTAQTLTFRLVTVDDEGATSSPALVNVNVAAVVQNDVLNIIDKILFTFEFDGLLTAFPGRANRETFRLKPSDPTGLVLEDGYFDFSENNVSKVEISVLDTTGVRIISTDTDSILIDRSKLHARMGDIPVKTTTKEFEPTISVFVGNDTRGVVMTAPGLAGGPKVKYYATTSRTV